MNEIMKKWIEALRSDRYRQGRGGLRSANDKFCCLGVACNEIDPTGWRDVSTPGFYRYSEEKRVGSLPNRMKEMLGLSSSVEAKLIEFNDSQRYTFDDIADYLESLYGDTRV